MKINLLSINKIYFLAALLLLPVLLLAIFSKDYRVYDYFFNPDSLYLSTMYQGLFIDGFPLRSFNLNPSILLVPDVIVYFAVQAITGNTILTSFIFTIIQHLLIFFAILFIFKNLFKNERWFLTTFSVLLMMLFFMGAILSEDILFAAFSLVSTNHVGAFVMMLICMALTLNYINRPKKSILVLIFVLSLLSIFSDLIFILMFPLPAGTVLIIQTLKYRKRAIILILVTIIVSMVSGIFLHNFVDGRYLYLAKIPEVSSPENIIPSFKLLMNDLGTFIMAANANSLIIVLSLFSYLSQLLLAVRIFKKEPLNSPLSFYFLFSVIYITIIFWMPVISGTYIAKHILRYNISAFYVAMVNIPVLIWYFISDLKERKTASLFTKFLIPVMIIIFLAIGITHLSKKGIHNFFDYYPEFVQELDEIAEKENLLCGVGHFWVAKPITTFSKKHLEVYHVWPNFSPYFHVNSRLCYTGDDQVFNFAVISGFDDREAYREFLDADGRIVKNGNTALLILPPFRFDKISGKPRFIEKSQEKQ